MEEISTKNRIELEFTINTSPHLLFNRLSTPSGLAEWFADDVNLSGKTFTFVWENVQQKAELLEKKENKSIKFRWIKDGANPKNFFSFKLSPLDLTRELSLQVVEQLDDNEDVEDAISLWNSQIGDLKRILGV
ncbi:MAG: SRPBCC domain-containing protein [Bacteroidales bacterium]|nr:MAG: SRPBCC domain-containing protein [Bacteroidales bacterium]